VFRQELSTALTLLGQPGVRKLDRSYLMPAGVRFDPPDGPRP
jgi:hypothetical protein